MPNGVTIKTVDEFQTLPPDTQRAVLFENLQEIKAQKGCQIEMCENRFKAIEKKKWWNAVASAGGGIIGGFIAMITKALWE